MISVPANIAEGSRRVHRRDYARFLNISEGSIAEVQYLLMVSRDLGFLSAEAAAPMLTEADEVSRMLYGLRSKVEALAGQE